LWVSGEDSEFNFLTCSQLKQKTFGQILLAAAVWKGGYGRGAGVGRLLGEGLVLGDGVGLGVAVAVAVAVGVGEGVPPAGAWIATIIGEPVLKNPTVAFLLSGG
jgi:hypothetical protein